MRANVDEIIYFLKSLKKGFDKDLLQSKIDELAFAVGTHGLVYEDFHTLFKVWLNLCIPISKWMNLGSCVIPPDMVEQTTIDYALRWLLDNLHRSNCSRVGFLLDWLTAAMETESIDMASLDVGYEIFYTILTFQALTIHALKLVYTLTKPMDVTRRRVLELLEYVNIREAKKSMLHQLHVLLGLFKSYKPECVPEDIPAISVHAAFKKIDINLLTNFKNVQVSRNQRGKERQHLLWINPCNFDRSKNKKLDPLVPNMAVRKEELGRYDRELPKSYLEFPDPVSLLQYSVHNNMPRPSRLRSLLCNETGLTLLVVISHQHQTFLSHDLQHLLKTCFLDGSPHSYAEKQDLLRRLAALQRTVLQGIPVLTRFLAQYLLLWNERDYFYEVLELVEWVCVFCGDHIKSIVESLSRVYHRAQPMEQCVILRALTTMYTNMVYASTMKRYHFLNTVPSPSSYQLVLPAVAAKITDLCDKELQVNPDEMHVLYSTIMSAERRAITELKYGAHIGALPGPLSLALPLMSVSAVLIDNMAGLMLLFEIGPIKFLFQSVHEVPILVGADKVWVVTTEEAAPVIKSYSPDLIVYAYFNNDSFSKISALLNKTDVVVIGPGLGLSDETLTMVSNIIDACRALKKPLVIDAHGLYVVAKNRSLIKNYPSPGVILTPNQREANILLTSVPGNSSSWYNFWGEYVSILVKGEEDSFFTSIASYNWMSSEGGSGRRVAGQGDILAGILGTVFNWALKQKKCGEHQQVQLSHSISAYAAAKLTRSCNSRGYTMNGRSMIASDMIHEIHNAFIDVLTKK